MPNKLQVHRQHAPRRDVLLQQMADPFDRELRVRPSEPPADALDMRVHRHEEARLVYAGPQAQIHSVGRPRHPSQEQIEPLARAALRRQRKQVGETRCMDRFARYRRIAQFPDKVFQAGADVAVADVAAEVIRPSRS